VVFTQALDVVGIAVIATMLKKWHELGFVFFGYIIGMLFMKNTNFHVNNYKLCAVLSWSIYGFILLISPPLTISCMIVAIYGLLLHDILANADRYFTWLAEWFANNKKNYKERFEKDDEDV
jgi:hypothetical protein